MDPTDAGEPQDTVWTAEACLTAFQAANEQYWNDHGLSMAHPPPTSPAPTAAQVVPLGAPSSSTSQPQPQVRPFELLPQREYVAKRRFEPKPPIIFRTWTQPYVRLADAFAGNVMLLQGRDEAVFSGDHLSQKQSLRLEIVGCRSYERQINVRTPANSFRSITKAKLAEKIAREIFDYMNRHQGVPFAHPRLNLGPGTAGFERLVLTELRHVSKSSWQPVLGVLSVQ